MYIRILIYAFISLLLLLSGCTVVPNKPTKPEEKPTQVDPAQQGKLLESQGKFAEAAQEYLRLASRVAAPTQQIYQLMAADAYLKGGMITEGKALLAKIGTQPSAGLQQRAELVNARLDLVEKHVDAAAERLKKINPESLTVTTRVQYYQLLAQIQEVNGQFLKAVQERIRLESLLTADTFATGQNREQIWQDLMAVPPGALMQVQQKTGDAFSGWVALALLFSSTPTAQRQQAVKEWQARFPNHPATARFAKDIAANTLPEVARNKSIALLLPLTGDFKEQAEAVREGFLAALYAEEGPASSKPQVKVYDVNAKNVLTEYQRVVKEGAQIIVGPLEKETINILVKNQAQLPVPTLTLNYTEASNINNLFQFGLSPEDEAKEAAIKASTDGRRAALILVPQGDWGDRVSTAFRQEWENRGGQIVKKLSYTNQMESAVKKLANDRSNADMILMVAFPPHARQLRPFLSYHLADSNLPIYSTSHVYTGTPSPQQDKDINDIMFADMPWVISPNEESKKLQATIQQSWPDMFVKHKRLYALGVDAYQILSHLPQLNSRYLQWPGQTGRLSLDDKGAIHRQLIWAQFVNGTPRPLGDNGQPLQE